MRSITRSPAQKSACKDLRRNGQSPAITAKDSLILRKEAGGRKVFYCRQLRN
ncbi:acetyltransferase [Lacticaseibacillus rhamnosus]|nr:Hypothetical protein LOCK900_0628 [Lacticaseibacillus rhamnosus LOCK900]MCT3144948.1 acetyltransferase [Lacticaseibacillus rhamnosus]MCT3153958.1 acetyltransferase [Lacticaseibacillus rhamnosus]MCT3161580.1 acetyltransferase [Lacticaseibacillus rhamnosus]MCT3165354.1 acetyltransferase [Lacticaseibacillus rhamnosus]